MSLFASRYYNDMIWNMKYNITFYISFMYQYYTHVTQMVLKLRTPTMPYIVYKVVKHNDETWEEDVSSQYFNGTVPRCEANERIEYRVRFKEKKYRVFSTAATFKEPGLSMFQNRRR